MAPFLTPRQLSKRGEFYYHFGQLTGAGVGLVDVVRMLARNPPASQFRKPLDQMYDLLTRGETFTTALERVQLWTPAFDIALIQAGEKSGRLDVVFGMLSADYGERAVILRQALSDMAYPVFVFHVAIFLFPLIAFFQHSNILIFLLSTIGVLVPLYVIVFALIYATQGQRGIGWRSKLERLLKPVPILGTARKALALSRLAAALEALLNAGVTIIESWDLAVVASGSPALQRAVAAWRPDVIAGMTPAEAVNQSREFPELFANLYNTGEVTGRLDDALKKLHRYYLEEGRNKLRILAQWVPRAVYLGVASLVAYRVIHFFSEYIQQINNAGSF